MHIVEDERRRVVLLRTVHRIPLSRAAAVHDINPNILFPTVCANGNLDIAMARIFVFRCFGECERVAVGMEPLAGGGRVNGADGENYGGQPPHERLHQAKLFMERILQNE